MIKSYEENKKEDSDMKTVYCKAKSAINRSILRKIYRNVKKNSENDNHNFLNCNKIYYSVRYNKVNIHKFYKMQLNFNIKFKFK